MMNMIKSVKTKIETVKNFLSDCKCCQLLLKETKEMRLASLIKQLEKEKHNLEEKIEKIKYWEEKGWISLVVSLVGVKYKTTLIEEKKARITLRSTLNQRIQALKEYQYKIKGNN